MFPSGLASARCVCTCFRWPRKLLLLGFSFVVLCYEEVKVIASHCFDMAAHGHTAGPGITFLFGNAEAEIVSVSHIGRNAHLENSYAFLATVNFVLVVGVLNLFQPLFLVELKLPDNRTVQEQGQRILETQFQLSVCLNDGCSAWVNQVALLGDVFIRFVMDFTNTAHFPHVGICHKVNVSTDRGEIGGHFKVIPVGRTGTSGWGSSF